MKTSRFCRLGAALCATSLAGALGLGCSSGAGDAASTSVRDAIEFSPSSTEATRTPASCGVTEPPFSSKDVFTLQALGDDAVAPRGALTLRLPASAPVGEAIPLTVGLGVLPPSRNAVSTTAVETAASSDGQIAFSLEVGSGSSELDGSGVASVVVTVEAIPVADGEPLSAEIQVFFDDGRELDQTFTADVRSAVVLCAAKSTAALGG